MADSKVSALTAAAASEIDGTEVLYIVDTSSKKITTASAKTYMNTSPTVVGDATYTTGSVIFSTTGEGIDFSAATGDQAGMTLEVLDDYEEGTWTPAYNSGAYSVGPTYTLQVGTYVKVGNLATVSGKITITGGTASTGTITITLPFTSKTASVDYSCIVPMDGINSTVPVVGVLPSNSATFTLYYQSTSGLYAFTGQTATTTHTMYFNLTYYTA